ncbi:hypothetical protein LTR49_017812 [Elasticomyces elasticus]|nr:hypothetical protein LTR49_017812 [Elasticomyces elasticus]KAK5766347.1 hypothetical protein LTS12_003559 [Elasticomyces elasticus]
MEKLDLSKSASASGEYTDSGEGQVHMSKDEAHLAAMGYKQGMNFISGIPVLFGWVMYTGGPTPAFANWTMIGGLSTIVSLSMAEIAAAMPVAGGIYFWSYRLGGEKWGPFLSWMTAWWNWMGWICVVPGVQQGSTNFLLSAIEISYPNATVVYKGWFAWLLTAIGMFFAMAPNIISQRVLRLYFRFATFIFFTLFLLYWIWFPAATAAHGQFRSGSEVFNHFYNGINGGETKEASDAYTWVIGILFGAWVFYGTFS